MEKRWFRWKITACIVQIHFAVSFSSLSKMCFWSAFLVVILTSPFFLCIPIPKFMGICTVCDRHLCASTRYKIQEIHKLGKNMRGVMLVFCRFFPKPNSFARFIDFDKLHEGLELWMEDTGSVPGKLSPGALQNHVPYTTTDCNITQKKS